MLCGVQSWRGEEVNHRLYLQGWTQGGGGGGGGGEEGQGIPYEKFLA